MKKQSLELACVFIILMFCLSPLSAMELSQDDNNTKYINHELNESNIDINDTDIVAVENKTLERPSIIQDKKDTKVSQKDNRESSRLSISVTPTDNPGEVLVKLSAVPKFKGTVYININGSSTDYEVYMHDGTGSLRIDNLSPGAHTAKAQFFGDEYYYAKNATTTFEVKGEAPSSLDPAAVADLNQVKLDDVKKNSSYLSISVTPTDNPGEALVKLSAVPRFKGTVYININGSSTDYEVYMHDGTGSLLVDNLSPGVHTAKAQFFGDEYYYAKNATTTFEVK